jgi:ribosome-associated heat shock protein Hsp15
MRIDQFLNSVNIAKSRSIATDMLKSGVVFINDNQAKPSKEVSVGNRVRVEYLNESKEWEILAIPTTKTTPKSKQSEYIKSTKEQA